MARTSKTIFTIRHFSAPGALGQRLLLPAHVEVNGDLDIGSAAGFRAVIGDLVDSHAVVIDLTDCHFVDSKGIGALVGAAHRLRLAGGDLTTTGATLAVNAALQAADLAADHHPVGLAEAVST